MWSLQLALLCIGKVTASLVASKIARNKVAPASPTPMRCAHSSNFSRDYQAPGTRNPAAFMLSFPYGPSPLPDSEQVWDATKLALTDPAQLMLADAEYDPSGLGS